MAAGASAEAAIISFLNNPEKDTAAMNRRNKQ